MADRIWNFNPGPATLPLPVLEKMKADLPNYMGTGMAVMELSHRSKQYAEIHAEAQSMMRELFNIPENYKTLLLQGGASTQFYMIPMNFLSEGQTGDYVNTGAWSKKAIKEGKLFGNVNVAGSSEDENFTYIPKDLNLDPNAKYVHITSNNTIAGTQWTTFPDTGGVPLMADMSSDIMSKKIDINRFGLIYAGAQKNLGPSGVTAVIIRDDLVEKGKDDIPTMTKYKTHAEKDSLFNTGPCWAIYICKLSLEHLKELGGVSAIEKINRKKAKILYDVMDNSNGFYKGHARKDSRSLMNVTFNLPSPELETKCVAEGVSRGFVGLKGHRSIGGMRASIYNAMSIEGVQALVEFMNEFQENNQ